MAETLVYNLITGAINIMPIRAVTFYDEENSEGLHFFQIESESSWRITPVQRPHYQGGQIIIAYKCELTIYIPNNAFQHQSWKLINRLDKLNNRYIKTQIILGNKEIWDNQPDPQPPWFTYPLDAQLTTKIINATDEMELDFSDNLMFNYEIEQVEFRPRLIIRPSGYIKSPTQVTDSEEELERMLFQ
jgi:hypothetical protein